MQRYTPLAGRKVSSIIQNHIRFALSRLCDSEAMSGLFTPFLSMAYLVRHTLIKALRKGSFLYLHIDARIHLLYVVAVHWHVKGSVCCIFTITVAVCWCVHNLTALFYFTGQHWSHYGEPCVSDYTGRD